MKIFNTLSGKKEVFEPIEDNKIRMYICGMTVYDDTHIGHARTFLSFDLIAVSYTHLTLPTNREV